VLIDSEEHPEMKSAGKGMPAAKAAKKIKMKLPKPTTAMAIFIKSKIERAQASGVKSVQKEGFIFFRL
jgi:hypothetical protein